MTAWGRLSSWRPSEKNKEKRRKWISSMLLRCQCARRDQTVLAAQKSRWIAFLLLVKSPGHDWAYLVEHSLKHYLRPQLPYGFYLPVFPSLLTLLAIQDRLSYQLTQSQQLPVQLHTRFTATHRCGTCPAGNQQLAKRGFSPSVGETASPALSKPLFIIDD